MRQNYQVKRINSPFDDTAFFVRNIHKKDAFLLDCGRLGDITNSELSDIKDIFISHTHIDHFYGFDRVIRGLLRSDNPIRLYGPPGFTKNVAGKLAGYTWNLIKSYPLTIEVYELGYGSIHKTIFSARDGFEAVDCGFTEGDIDIDDGFKVQYCFFDHKTVSVGYRIKEPNYISINKEKLESIGLKSGKWVGFLKEDLYKGNRNSDIFIEDVNCYFSVSELEKLIVEYQKPQDITYITDIAPTYENFDRAIKFAKDSHLLIIESMFMKSDFMHSIEKSHLNISLSKTIYEISGSRFVKFFHFAPKYENCKDKFYSELRSGIEEKII